MDTPIPRKANLQLLTPVERDIRLIIDAVEALGASVALSSVVSSLGLAADQVADWVDTALLFESLDFEYAHDCASIDVLNSGDDKYIHYNPREGRYWCSFSRDSKESHLVFVLYKDAITGEVRGTSDLINPRS